MKSIQEIIQEHIKEKYRKKINSTKALRKDNTALKDLFRSIVELQARSQGRIDGLNEEEKVEMEKMIEEIFITEDEFKV